MKKTWLWTPAVLILLAIGSYGAFRYFTAQSLPTTVLYGNGHIEGTEVRVAAEVAGRIVESRLVEGEVVAKGDLLVRIDDQDLKIRLAQAAAEKLAIQREKERLAEQLLTAKHHFDVAQSDLRRYRDLQSRGTVSPQRLEQAENANQAARGQVAALEASLTEADARLEAAVQNAVYIQTQIDKAAVQATVAGTVLVKAVENGEFVAIGQTVATLVDLTRIELKVFIPERDIGKIKLGERARVRTDAFPNRYVEARVARVDQRAQFTPRDIHMPEERTRMVFGVTLTLDNPGGELKPGMPADGWILWQEGADWPDRLLVPR